MIGEILLTCFFIILIALGGSGLAILSLGIIFWISDSEYARYILVSTIIIVTVTLGITGFVLIQLGW